MYLFHTDYRGAVKSGHTLSLGSLSATLLVGYGASAKQYGHFPDCLKMGLQGQMMQMPCS